MKYARMADDIVAELIDLPEDITPADAFHPDISSALTACPPDVEEGWILEGDGETFSPPPGPSLDNRKASSLAAVNARRDVTIAGGYRHNFGGTAGIRILDQRGEADAINWLGLKGIVDAKVAAGNGGDLLPMRDARDDIFTASASVISAALIGMAQWRLTVMGRSWELKDAITAADDEAELEAIDVDEGWAV